jgi:ketosteroid isomerase-like protein
MKTLIAARFFAALILFLNSVAFAERPSTDEVAIRLGVAAWFNGRTTLPQPTNAASLKALYRPELEATENVNGASSSAHGLSEYLTLWRPFFDSLASVSAAPTGDLKLSIKGDHAITTFSFVPQGTYNDGTPVTCGAHVSLTWKKHDGLWQIAREEIRPLRAAVDSARSTTQR